MGRMVGGRVFHSKPVTSHWILCQQTGLVFEAATLQKKKVHQSTRYVQYSVGEHNNYRVHVLCSRVLLTLGRIEVY